MIISTIVVDDQPLIRSAVRSLLEDQPDLTVLGEAATGTEAIDLTRRLRPNVVVMDIRMPIMDGIDATRILTTDPETADSHVLVLTTFEEDEYVFRALRAGASGFVGKGTDPDELVHAVRTVARGESLLSPRATRALIDRFLPRSADPDKVRTPDGIDDLTERELEIVILVAKGLSNEQIADRLVISPFTVKTHLNHAMSKLAVHDRAQIVILAYEHGLLSRGKAVPDPDL